MTLLEVMAGASILLIVLLSIGLLVGTSGRREIAIHEAETALFDLEAVKERIALTPFRSIPVDGAFPADGSDVAANSGVVKSLSNEVITVTYPGWDWQTWYDNGKNPAGIPDPLTILIQVTWNDELGGGVQTLTLTTARSKTVR